MSYKDSAKKDKKTKKRRNPFRYFVYYFTVITGALTVLIWLRPKRLFENKKAKKHIRGGGVIVANHTNMRDPIALFVAFWYRRVHTITLQELFINKLSGWFFRHVLCIPVNRENFNMQTFRTATEVLKEGELLSIFPEGHINDDKSTIQSFKSGATLMALNAKVPIIPVYLSPYTKWYKRTVIVMGEPIYPQDFCNGTPNVNSLQELSNRLREKELELMEIYEKWKAKK